MTDSNIKITAKPRKITGKKVKQLREQGLTPAVVYGSGIESTPVSVNTKEFIKLYKAAGESTIVDLQVEDSKDNMKVLIKDLDVDYVKRKVLHVSFYKVNMKEEIDTVVPFSFVGEAPAEKDGGIVLTSIDEIEIRCLPSDLPESIEISISSLNKIGDSIALKDLELPKGVKLMKEENELNQTIVSITAPATEEEEAAKLAEGEAPLEEVEITEQTEEAVEETVTEE